MLHGTIDDVLAVSVTLLTSDLDELERKKIVYGTMRRPRQERERVTRPESDDDETPYGQLSNVAKEAGKKQKAKKSAEEPPAHVDAQLTLRIDKSHFRVTGSPESNEYKRKHAYELWLMMSQAKELRAKGRLEYRERLPCNRLTIILEDYVAPSAPAQSVTNR